MVSKRLSFVAGGLMLALSGILGVAVVASSVDSAQVIIVTPLDQGDTTPTYAEYPTAEALICEGDCACYFYSFADVDGTQVVMAECGQVAERTTATPPVMLVTPTPVWQGPTLTPTIEQVIGRYCFTGSTYQNIRTGANPTDPIVGRLNRGQCMEVLSIYLYPNGDQWLRGQAGWVAYRINGNQLGSYVQIVN